MNYEKTKKAYDEVLEVMNNHSNTCILDIEYVINCMKRHLFKIELEEKHGYIIQDIKRMVCTKWERFGDYVCIGYFGHNAARLTNSDNGDYPKEEHLLEISFGSGAYIFGDDYPKSIFEQFFSKLVSYKPDFTDIANNCLYWKIDNGANVFNDFKNILEEYRRINIEDYKHREIKRLQNRINKLSL